jgi:prolyl oligopeptidase
LEKAQHDYGIEYLKATQKLHEGVRNEIAAYIDID